MKYQNLFSGEIEKNISICRLLKILPRVLSVNISFFVSLNTACLVFVLIFPENSVPGIFLIFPETECLVFRSYFSRKQSAWYFTFIFPKTGMLSKHLK